MGMLNEIRLIYNTNVAGNNMRYKSTPHFIWECRNYVQPKQLCQFELLNKPGLHSKMVREIDDYAGDGTWGGGGRCVRGCWNTPDYWAAGKGLRKHTVLDSVACKTADLVDFFQVILGEEWQGSWKR